MLKLIKNTTAEDAERAIDAAPPVRYRETESAVAAAQRQQRTYSVRLADKIMGTGPRCTGLCHQGRALCVHPVECGVQHHVAESAPAPAEAATDVGSGYVPANSVERTHRLIVGGVVVLLVIIAFVGFLARVAA